MALNLGTLVLSLGVDLNDLNSKLQTAQQTVLAAGANMQKSFAGFGQTASGLYVPLGAVQQGLGKVGQTAQTATTHVGHMNTAMQHTQDTLNLLFGGMALTTTLTAPFALFAKSAYEASVGFESAFAGVRKTVDATEGEFQQLEDRFRSMAQVAPVTAEQFAKIGELAGQLGVRGVDNLTKFSDTIAKLGVSTNLGIEEASLSLARFANIMQLPIGEVDRLGATIVALGNNMAARETEIVDFGQRLAASGKQIGLSSAQVMAFGAALAAVGINAEAGGTAFSRVFAKLATAVAEGEDDLSMFAQVAGMSAEAFAKAFQEDAAGAIIAFVSGLKRLQDSGVNLFGVMEKLNMDEVRVRNALMATAGAGDILSKAMGIATQAFAENNALNTEAGKRFATTESQIKMLKNTWAEFARQIGDAFAPALTGLAELLKNILKVAIDLPAPIKVMGTVFGGLLAAIGPLLIGFYTLNMAIQGVKTAMGMLGIASAAWLPIAGQVVAVLAVLSVFSLGWAASQRKAAEESLKNSKSLVDLNGKYDALQKVLDDNTKSADEHTKAEQEQKQIIEQIGELFPGVVALWDSHGKAVELDTRRLNENTDASKRNIAVSAQKTLQNAEKAMADVQEEIRQVQETKASTLESSFAKGFLGLFGNTPEDIASSYDATIANLERKLDDARGRVQKAWAMLYGAQKVAAEDARDYIDPNDPLGGKRPGGKTTGTDVDFGAPVSAITKLEHLLKRMDAAWEIYKTGLGNAATGSAFVAKQQEYLTERMGLLNQTIDAVSAAWTKSKAKTGEFSEATMKLADQLDGARKELASSQAEFAKIASPLLVAKTNLVMLEAQLDRTTGAWNTYKSGLGDAAKGTAFVAREQDYLSNRMIQLKAVIDGTSKAYELSKAETGAFSEETLGLAQKLDTANQALAETKAQFAELSPEVVQAKTDLDDAKKAVTQLKDQIEHLNAALSDARDKYEETSRQVKEFQDSNKEAKTVIGEALGAMRDRIKDVKDEIKDLNDATKDAQQGIVTALSVMAERAKEVADAIKDVQDKIKNSLGAMKDRIGEVKDQMSDLKDSIQDSKSGISDAFSVMTDRAKDVEDQINRARTAMQNLANVKLTGEGALDSEMAVLERREALIQLAMNKLQQTPAGRNSAQLKALQRQLDQIGLLKENLQLQQKLNFDPLHDELQRLVDDTKEMSFEEAKQGILNYQQQIVDLTAKHADMTKQIDDLSASVGLLVPSVAKSNMTFDEAVKAVGTHKVALEADNQALSNLTALYNSMVSDFESLRKSLSATIPDLGDSFQSFADAKKAIEGYKSQVETLTKQHDEMEETIKGLRNGVKDLVPKVLTTDEAFEEAVRSVLGFMSAIKNNKDALDGPTGLVAQQEKLQGRYDDLLKVLGDDLIPKIGIAGLSFDDAKKKIDEMVERIQKNNAQLDGPNGLLALQEKQKGTVDLLDYGMGLFKDALLAATDKEVATTSALEVLRQAALNAAGAMSGVRSAPSTPPPASWSDVLPPANIPPWQGTIRAMAAGALVTRPTYALIGEDGPEAVLPLSALGDRMQAFNSGIWAAANSFGGGSPEGSLAMAGGGGTFAPNFSIYMGEKQFYDFVVEANENARRRGR